MRVYVSEYYLNFCNYRQDIVGSFDQTIGKKNPTRCGLSWTFLALQNTVYIEDGQRSRGHIQTRDSLGCRLQLTDKNSDHFNYVSLGLCSAFNEHANVNDNNDVSSFGAITAWTRFYYTKGKFDDPPHRRYTFL